jgi:hypothetical protein
MTAQQAASAVQCRNVAQLAAAMGAVQTGVADGDFLQRETQVFSRSLTARLEAYGLVFFTCHYCFLLFCLTFFLSYTPCFV